MAIDTLESTDLSRVTKFFKPRKCIHLECTKRAKGAVFLPLCGKHLLCRKHLKMYKQHFKGALLNHGEWLTIFCGFHHTTGNYRHNPVRFVG